MDANPVALLLSGLFMLGLGLFGGASHKIRRYRRTIVLMGIALLVAWLLPQMARAFNEGFQVGTEIRQQQGR